MMVISLDKNKSMQNIKFTEDEGNKFYAELNQQVQRYFSEHNKSYSGGKIMIFKIVLYFGLTGFAYLCMIQSETPIGFIVSYLLMGLGVLLCAFNISHDAAHNVAVKNKRLNKWLFQLSFNLQGNNAFIWGNHHTKSHHS